MYLNTLLPDVGAPNATSAQSLLRSVLDVTTRSIALDACENQEIGKISSSCKKFFELFYVKPDLSGRFVIEGSDIRFSAVEAHILGFFLSDESKDRPYILKDYAGKGKSTILKYISYYVYNSSPPLENLYLPVYVSLRIYEAELRGCEKTSDVFLLLDKVVKKTCFQKAYTYFLSNPKPILKWLNTTYPSNLQGRFSESIILTATKNPGEFVSSLLEGPPSKMTDFIVGVLCHHSTHRCPVALIIDDGDHFSLDIQRTLLDYAKQKISAGFRCLVALRDSTWRSLENINRDYEPTLSPRITWSFSQIKDLLHRRIHNAKETVTLSEFSNIKADIESETVIDAFIDLLKNEQTAELLIKTSNYNLHSLMRKLAFMSSSWHFNDRYLLKEHLLSYTKSEKKGIPSWLIYGLLFGTYKGTFKSTNSAANTGLINCFYNSSEKYEPYTFFLRVQLLSRIIKYNNESEAVSVREIIGEYTRIFGDHLSLSDMLHRTLYRLIESGLIDTRSRRRYSQFGEVKEHIDDDSIYITVAGEYYFKWVICHIDYLYFMKDDIDWPDNAKLEDIQPAKVGDSRSARATQALKALRELTKLETRMITNLYERVTKPGDSQLVFDYVLLFSAKKENNKEVLFTEKMFNSFRQDLYWSYGSIGNGINSQLEDIQSIITNCSALGGFSDINTRESLDSGKVAIQISLFGEYNLFTDSDSVRIIKELEEILDVQDELIIKKIEEGSIIITLEVTKEQAEELLWLHQRRVLRQFGVNGIEVLEEKIASAIVNGKEDSKEYDVFMCHNSEDKKEVARIALKLRRKGILPWIDEFEIRPGVSWQYALQEQIASIRSVAVFIGNSGIGPWQDQEILAFLREFVERRCPVIPVVLRSCQSIPEILPLLNGMHAVNFKKSNPNPYVQLVWGITGKKIDAGSMLQ